MNTAEPLSQPMLDTQASPNIAQNSLRRLRVKEAASQYGLTQALLRKLIFTRRIAYEKVGRGVYLDPVAIETLFRRGRVESLPEGRRP